MTDATKRWLDEDEQETYADYEDERDIEVFGNLMDIIDRLCADLDKQQEVIETAICFSNEGDNRAARYVLEQAAAAARAGEGRG